MITTIITSARTAFYMGVVYVLMIITGISMGLGITGPFDYLDTQLLFYNLRVDTMTDLQPAIETAPWIEPIYTTGFDIMMRGVTIGYNLPSWVSPDIVVVVGFYIIIAAMIVFFRAWRYTTTSYIK